VFLDAQKDEYERYFTLVRHLVEPGGVIVADNVLSHEEILGAYSEARQSDPTLVSVTVPLDRGLELTAVLAP
jgi:predicted O-methyltransferase YrrM